MHQVIVGGVGMGTPRVATFIVEPRFLVREALASLMGKLSYRVVSSVGTATDISYSMTGERRKLAILGALSAENAIDEAAIIRKMWPESKIVLLVDSASSADFQQLINSQIDGCVPLHVSADALSSTLKLIVLQGLRVMVFGGPTVQMKQETDPEEGHSSANGVDRSASSASSAPHPGSTAQAMKPNLTAAHGNGAATTNAGNASAMACATSPHEPALSGRETQVLDGLTKGHANKVIARTCEISEATVKVHMKSILRKIRVANRTQAAIWALEHGYSA
jgi:two-component system nitrate/nitrite response regulator NarL